MIDREINVIYDVEEDSIAICYPERVAVHKMRPESAERFGRTIIKAVKALRRSKQHGRTQHHPRSGNNTSTEEGGAAITKADNEVGDDKGQAR